MSIETSDTTENTEHKHPFADMTEKEIADDFYIRYQNYIKSDKHLKQVLHNTVAEGKTITETDEEQACELADKKLKNLDHKVHVLNLTLDLDKSYIRAMHVPSPHVDGSIYKPKYADLEDQLPKEAYEPWRIAEKEYAADTSHPPVNPGDLEVAKNTPGISTSHERIHTSTNSDEDITKVSFDYLDKLGEDLEKAYSDGITDEETLREIKNIFEPIEMYVRIILIRYFLEKFEICTANDTIVPAHILMLWQTCQEMTPSVMKEKLDQILTDFFLQVGAIEQKDFFKNNPMRGTIDINEKARKNIDEQMNRVVDASSEQVNDSG